MGIKERLFEHPAAAFTGCIAWLPIAIMIYVLVSWMIQGDVDGLVCFLGITICVIFGGLALVPPRDEIAIIICIVSYITVLGFPVIRAVLDKRELAKVDIEAIERTYEALGQRPLNPSLRFRLAKLLYARGLLQEAIAVAERTMSGMPTQFFLEEHREFQKWKRQLTGPPRDSFVCLQCHHENLAGEVFCQGCAQPLMLPIARGNWVGGKFLRQMLIVWVGGVSLLIGIPLVTITVPGVLSGFAVILLVGVVAFLVYVALTRGSDPGSNNSGRMR